MSQVQQALPMIEKGAVPFDENGFVDWTVDAQACDCITYYRGHLARDRYPNCGILTPGTCQQLVAVAQRVMAAAEQGVVFPVQVRLGPHDFLYLAIRATGRLGDPLANTRAVRAAAIPETRYVAPALAA